MSLDVNDVCKRPIAKLKRHYSLWWIHTDAHNLRK